MKEDGQGNVVVDIAFPKYMDSSMMVLDIQPWYFRVTVKKPEKHDKILQLLFPCEVRADWCEAKRSQSTGNLLLVLPMLNWSPPSMDEVWRGRTTGSNETIPSISKKYSRPGACLKGGLNITTMAKESPNATNICSDIRSAASQAGNKAKDEDSDFEDDPGCPPLE